MNTTKTTTNPLPDVPLPPDATYVHDQGVFDADGERLFWGTDREGVLTAGFQKADGSVRARWIKLDHHVGELSAAEARQYAARLIAAADELERLAGTESP